MQLCPSGSSGPFRTSAPASVWTLIPRPAGHTRLKQHLEWTNRPGRGAAGGTPTVRDLARLLSEHATAASAAACRCLKEVNQLVHHRRLVLDVTGVKSRDDVDHLALEIEEGQDLSVRRWGTARLHLRLLAEIQIEVSLGHRDHFRQRARYRGVGSLCDPAQDGSHQ